MHTRRITTTILVCTLIVKESLMPDSVFRCAWAQSALSEHQEYHDKEWTVPCTYDRVLFKNHATENEMSNPRRHHSSTE